ncbi:hypothetical protein OJF2_12190 [Aquisphaera giovannonii]|uniref:Uncharacterized protein n=1 Tax=Aquisphaera giovannonii TaxID=406548 RepID=A0A5B9VYP5_9BACT|nr:hypothetical protein [Aquisphaera giovannonii]QEH32740.1 hypothetical protein OJF2_12190 [Aquisphaera giovannonii]
MGMLDLMKRGRDAWRDLAGKVVVIYEREGKGCVLSDVKVVDLGFNCFLVGRMQDLDPSDGRYSGVTAWVAASSIERMLCFGDIDAARRSFADATKETAPKSPTAS